jgi:orotidine-5'-phosphate decarboxylase
MTDSRGGYLDRLAARTADVASVLCLGVDPDPAALPKGFPGNVAGIEAFARLLIEAGADRAAAIKINVAFFEAFGSAGYAALERVRALIPADLPFIADAKRGDIGNTAMRQATALLDGLAADAVTLSPYLGLDALAPFLDDPDHFVYVLARTSNRSAREIQDLAIDGEPLFVHVARQAVAWAEGAADNIGLVVGATAAPELAAVRAAAPGLAFLVPGVGAQGGDMGATLEHGAATAAPAAGHAGGGLLVNLSRAISGAALGPGDPGQAIAAAAAQWAGRLKVPGVAAPLC